MKKKLLNNIGLKIISLILAFLLWFMVVQTTDPKDDKDMGNIPVTLVNTSLLDNENKVFEVLDNTDSVRVTVFAPRSVLKSLRTGDIIAEADVSKLTDINTVPISFRSVNADNIDIKGGHDVVKLNVEDKQSKYVSLVTEIVGDVADGYIVYGLTPDQNRIEVSGPKSVVEKVKYARAEIDVTEATNNLVANVEIRLCDAQDNPIDRSRLVQNVDYVKLSVEVLAVKEVPVELNITGEPEDGYMATGVVESDPATVKIAANPHALSRINSIIIPEERLDITKAAGNLEETINIQEYLPDNIKLADNDFNGKISVTVHVEPVYGKNLQIPWENVMVKNSQESVDYKLEIAESEDDAYSLGVKGLRERINQLRPEEINGIVDIENWMRKENMHQLRPGTYSVPVTFMLGDDITIEDAPRVRLIVSEGE